MSRTEITILYSGTNVGIRRTTEIMGELKKGKRKKKTVGDEKLKTKNTQREGVVTSNPILSSSYKHPLTTI